jgi:hypothetical protein
MAMNSTSAILRPVSHLAVWGLLAAFATGCSAADSGPANDEPSLGPGHQQVAEFMIHAQPSKKKLTIRKITPQLRDAMERPGFTPQAMFDANVQSDGTAGTGPANSVELVTTAVYDTFGGGTMSSRCPAANLFCADVTLNSFFPSTLNFTNAQVTSITDVTGKPITGHGGFNSDYAGNTGLDRSLGLWIHESQIVAGKGSHPTGTSTFIQGAQGVVVPYSSTTPTLAGATANWQFNNPDDADTYIRIRVMAAQTYSNYKLNTSASLSSSTYLDPCTLNAGDTKESVLTAPGGSDAGWPANTNAAVYSVFRFPFTYYGTKYGTTATTGRLYYSKFGNLVPNPGPAGTSILSGLPSTTDNSGTTGVALPSSASTTPRPAVFLWWDNIGAANFAPYNSNTGLCAKSLGTAPNRQFMIGWNNVGASGNGNTGPFVQMSAVFNEGTEEIWLNYGAPVAGPGAKSWSATVGGQDSTCTNAAVGSVTVTSSYPGNGGAVRYVLQPIP